MELDFRSRHYLGIGKIYFRVVMIEKDFIVVPTMSLVNNGVSTGC